MAASPSHLLAQHIESFVDASRPSTLQASSLDEIVALLKNDTLTMESLVRELEMYLTTTDHVLRARGILLLGEVLARLSTKPLDDATVHTLILFFTDRLADWRALRGALVGCLTLLRRKPRGVVSGADAKAVAKSYLENLQVQSLGQHDRKLCFELLECLLEQYAGPLAPLGEHLVYGICEAIDEEKDPKCLMLTFHIVEILVQNFPDPCSPISSYISDLFAILGCYFPIHFTHATPEDTDVKRDELSRALMLAFSATPLFEPFVIPLLLEKLSSSLQSAKIDSLKFLNHCLLKYGAERMAKHAGGIWSSLKDALRTSGKELGSSFTPESLDGSYSDEDEIVREALMLLESVIIQNRDLFLNLIVGDEEIRMILVNTNSHKSYNEIPMQAKKELQVVCQILYVSAKVSVASCNRMFESFLPRLMETLEHSIDNDVISRRPLFEPLFLCTELLRACRDLCMGSGDLKPSNSSSDMTWCILLQRFHTSLCKIFSSNMSTACKEPAEDVDIYLGVKGLQILATFPGGYALIPKLTFDNILLTLVSIISADYKKSLSWKLALKALINIGSFIHAYNDPEKAMSYMDIVIEKVLLFISSGDFSMPLSLKLEALSKIGTSGVSYMLKIGQVLEDVILTNLEELYVHGNTKSSKALLQLLECYSDKLVPWFQQNGGLEEILFQLVVKIWSKIENCKSFSVWLDGEDILEATMKLMKLAVASCSVVHQNTIACKAYDVLLARMSPSLKESLFISPVGSRAIDLTKEMNQSISGDEWVQSLFASVIIALRPETQVPNIRTVLRLFMSYFMKGYVIAAQALGSLVNKLDPNPSQNQVSVNCTLEEAIEILFDLTFWSSSLGHPIERFDIKSNGNTMNLASILSKAGESELLQTHAIVGLAWIGKGLLMRGHERIRDITMVFLECLLSNGRTCLPMEAESSGSVKHGMHLSAMRCAADAFQILMGDSELCLNRKFHSVLRPLYKQRFFSTVMPILQSLITRSDLPVTRCMLYRAFAHVISETPLTAVLTDAKKLIPMLVDALKLLGKDIADRDTVYSLLLVLSGILTDRNGREAAIEDAHIIVDGVVGLISYPHMMVVRETAIQCLGAISDLPHTTMYPLRLQVLQATLKALDDPKRAVRQEAVRCRHAWASITSRGLHL